MAFLLVISSFAAIISIVTGWENHRGPIAREEASNYGAWYQMPQPAVAAYPPSAYDRAVAASAAAGAIPYAGYPRPYSRSPDYYPETAVTNNMVPSGGRKSAAVAGYYGQSPQDTYQISVIDRYFPLLGRKRGNSGMGSGKGQQTLQPRFASTSPTPPNAASVMRTLKPRKPFIETWKCARKPCPRTLKPLPLTTKEEKRKIVKQTKKKVTPMPENLKTFATVEGVRLASVKPYTFRPRHKQSNKKIMKITTAAPTIVSTTTLKITTSTTTPSKPSTTTTMAPKSTTTTAPKKTKKIVTPKATTLAPKISSTTKPPTSTSLPPFTTTTATTSVTEATKHRVKRPEVTKRIPQQPLKLIKITPFTTQEPQTLRTEATLRPSTSVPSRFSFSTSTLSSSSISPSISTSSPPINFPYSLIWGKDSSTSRPQNSNSDSSSIITTTRATLPLQVVASRIYQLLESQLTNSAIEFEEMRQLTEENVKDKQQSWSLEEKISKLEKALERKQKRMEIIAERRQPKEASYEDEIIPEPQPSSPPPKRRVKIAERKKASCPNAELISAIKDVVRKFKASLDRTGVHEDVRHMSTQLESTWNDLRRGIQRSFAAFRQSAETALLSPSLTSSSSSASSSSQPLQQQQSPLLLPPPPPLSLLTGEPYPYIITQRLLTSSFMKDPNNNSKMVDKKDNNNPNIDTNNANILQYDNTLSNSPEVVVGGLMASSNDSHSNNVVVKKQQRMNKMDTKKDYNPFRQLLIENLNNDNNETNIDLEKNSGKLDQWIERAHQMLADSVSEEDVKALLQHQKQQQQQKQAAAKAEYSPLQIPKEKINKAVVAINGGAAAEKINPKFTSITAANEVN